MGTLEKGISYRQETGPSVLSANLFGMYSEVSTDHY